MQIDSKTRQKAYFLLLVATAFTAIAAGLSEGTFNNFYADVYNVTARQRGFIEFPREIPGLIAVLVISLMSFMGEIKLAIVAQILSITGLILLGVFTPPFALMLVFLFVNSMGMHLYMPLKDSIGLNIIGDENTASKFGVLNGVRTGAGFLAALVIFIGARFGWFSFTDHAVIRHFLIATLFFVVVVLILVKIMKLIGNPKLSVSMATDEESEKDRSLIMRHVRKRFIFRREYKFYYMLAALHGAHKQIAGVFGPWVLVYLLMRQMDRMAVLGMIGMFLGVFFIPAAGKFTNRFGVRTTMFIEGASFIVLYILFGVFAAGLVTGRIAGVGVPVIVIYVLFILDRMTMQLGMIRALYLRSIAVDKGEIAQTLSTGMSLDHAISIIGALLGGLVWDTWGPQFVFFIAAGLSLGNVLVAFWIPRKTPETAV